MLFYARQLYRQVLLRARISYGNSVHLSVCPGVTTRYPIKPRSDRDTGFSPGLAGFCQKVEKTGFFHGKNRTGKNSFCRQKIGFCQNIFFNTFITIKYCCNAYIILTSISVLNSTLIVLVTYLFGRYCPFYP